MKKFLKIFVIVMLTITLVGCGSKKKTDTLKVCTLTSEDSEMGYKLESKYEILGEKDTIDSIKIEEKITSDDKEILEYYENYFQVLYENNNNEFGGYTNKVTKSNNMVLSNTTISYSDVDMKKYLEQNSVMKSYVDKNNKFLLKGLTSYYEALGATCK